MKIFVITENQKEFLLNNDKPSVRFDEKYGTTLSQRYRLPFGLTDEMVWTVYQKCKHHEHIKQGDKFLGVNRFRKTPDEYCKIWEKIVNSLTSEHFPFKGVESLPFIYKEDILRGMVSQFNVDDIIHFSIKRIFGYDNSKVKNEVNKTFPRYIVNDINWVISPETLEKMKQQISDRRLNISQYADYNN